jgi:GH18 family chitinase
VEADIEALRFQNPKLKVIGSLGGSAVKASTFSSLITDIESLNNLTTSINQYYRDGLLDGVEIDWEWPVKDGGKKDRIKLIRYARVNIIYTAQT